MNSEQFKKLLLRANILDASYPVRGAHVWLPDGFRFKKLVFSRLEAMLEDAGYEQYEFPRLMPGSSLRKIAEEVKDFSESVFWLKYGYKETDIFLNPTGESGIYPMLQQWVRVPSDLPIRLFQVGATFRSHSRPYPLINSDESTPLLEGHGVFETRQDVVNEFEVVLGILETMHTTLAIPYRMVARPQWGNNPVSERNISFESYFPPKDVNLNIGVAYLQDQIFSRLFGIKFEKDGSEPEHTHQLTFGINERALAAMLSIHSDDYGLRFLPEFAPKQIVVISDSKSDEDKYCVNEYTGRVEAGLEGRTYIDDTKNRTIKQKFNQWRERGIPVLVAIGPDNVRSQTVGIYRRDKNEWETISADGMKQTISRYFGEIEKSIRQKSEAFLRERIKTVGSYTELVELVSQNYMVRFDYCGLPECGERMESGSVGEILGLGVAEKAQDKCVGCGNDATSVGYFSRRAQSP